MGEWWAVACQYRLINRCIAGGMKLLARYIKFGCVSANSARMILRSALSQGQVSIRRTDYQYIQIMMKTIIDWSRCWMENTLKSVSTERQRFVEERQRHAPCRILRMRVNGASMIFSFASWVIYVPIGCRHPFVRYWQPLLPKTTVTCSLPHPENQRQRSVNNAKPCILGNLCSDWL